MGRNRQMARSKALTIRKTDGWTIADEDLILVLQMVSITEATRYLSYWHKNMVRDLERAKRRHLVTWDKREKGYSPDTVAFAGLRLTDKGLKILSAGGGRFIPKAVG